MAKQSAHSILNQAKVQAGKIADTAEQHARGAADVLMRGRRTRGANAALVAGLVVGALIERGRADAAEAFTKEIARHAAE